MTKCKFCNECKKPSTIMGPICGYYKDASTIMGPICGYCNEWRMLATICGPYEGIARMQNASGYYGTYMWVLQWMQNASGYFRTYM